MQYYYSINNQQLGPVDETQLVSCGVTRDTLVWCNGMPAWLPAGQVPGLANYFAAPMTSPQAAPAYGVSPQMAYQQAQQTQGPKPDNYLVWAILSTLLCCLPLGIVSIVYSTKVDKLYNSGDYKGAVDAAANAKKWAMWSAIAGVVSIVIYFIVIGVGAASSY